MRALFILLLLLPLSSFAELADPLRPPGARASSPSRTASGQATAPEWVLQSTLTDASRRSAVINQRSVQVGDRVDGAQVLAIEPGRVELASPSRRFTITLWNETPVKQPSRTGEPTGP